MNAIILLNLSWHCYAGFLLEVLRLESWRGINIDRSLFCIQIKKRYVYIELLFIPISIYRRTKSYNYMEDLNDLYEKYEKESDRISNNIIKRI